MEFIKLILKKLNHSITGGAIVIAIFSILAKLLGLLRDRLLASNFGAGDILDSYYAAFRLPDLIFNTLVLGALSAAFIPIFISLKQAKQSTEAGKNSSSNEASGKIINHWQLSAAIMNILFIILSVLAIILYFAANKIVPWVAPGFEGHKLALTVQMTKIMLLSILFFGISNVLSGILQSTKKFAMFALAPVMYNLGIIFGILFLVNKMGAVGLAWGVVLGAFMHLCIQLPSVIKLGFRWQPILAFNNKLVRRIGKLMLPRTIGLAGNQINQLVITIIASTLLPGSLAIFNLAFNLESVPIGIFAVSLAITAFPAMSESFNLKDKYKFLDHFSTTLNRILFLIIPVSIFIIALRAQIVRLVLGAGEFDWQDTILTAEALGFFAVSMFAQGLIPLLARTFYAFQNTKIPVYISLVTVAINIMASIILAPKLGVTGLVIAFSLASIIQLILLITVLHYKIGHLNEKRIIFSAIRIITATLGATLFLQLTKYLVGNAVNMYTYIGVLTQFLAAVAVGSLTYLAISWMVGSQEIMVIKKLLVKK